MQAAVAVGVAVPLEVQVLAAVVPLLVLVRLAEQQAQRIVAVVVVAQPMVLRAATVVAVWSLSATPTHLI